MNLKKIIILGHLVLFVLGCQQKTSKDEKLKKYHPKYELLKVGQVKVGGWMLEQMNTDLSVGYLASFEEISPYINQDVFNAKRVTTNERYPDYLHLGNWWGAEEEFYLKDGMLRMAIQSDNKEILKRASSWMERLLEYQGEDGYLGMYVEGEEKDTRFNHVADNGELWCQSRMMSAMLSWYEYTGDKRFLTAVERAVKLDASHYMKRNYFENARGIKGSGVTHAVGFFDILEWLIRLTDDQLYVDFAKKYYEDFNAVPTRNNEMSTAKLLDENLKFQDHTPHIVEGAYMQHLYASLTGNADAEKASKIAMTKIAYHSGPGGGVLGDEDVRGLQGTADTYREYCALPELVFSLNRVASISGQVDVGDMVERIVFNASQAARLPDLTALEYLSSDNRLTINSCEHDGRLAYDANRSKCVNGVPPTDSFKQEAVCCVTSAARVLPYYIDGMWMKTVDKPGVVAMYYGPTTVNLNIEGVNITIEEQTNYPFSDEISFKLKMDKSLTFDLQLRIPEGADDILIEHSNAKKSKDEDFVYLNKNWKDGDVVKVKFPFGIKKIAQPISKTVPRPGYYIQRGPLVYSLQFPHAMKKGVEYNNTGYFRYDVETLDETGWDYSIDENATFKLKNNTKADTNTPWANSPVFLEGNLIDKNGNLQSVKLVPEGCTVLRRVTFPGL